MRVRVAGAVTGIAAAVVLAGCSSGSSGGSAAGTSSAPSSSAAGSSSAAASSSAQGQAKTVDVKATEYAFSLATTTFSPGTYTFTMANDGHATHAIEIDGPGVADQKSSTAGPGGTSTLTVTLQPGSYTLYCPVGNHRQLGMQTMLTVQ
jgi:plastocyanin